MAGFGVLGLGVMGGSMARNLLGAGEEVYGYDINPDRGRELSGYGLVPVDIPAELARRCDVVLISVATGEQLLSAVDGLLEGMRDGLLVVDASTVDPEASAVARKRIEAAGGSLLCAPVSGSAQLAESGQLTVICSGRDEDYERAARLLNVIAAKSALIGSADEARAMKLIVNLVVIGTMELVAESLALGEALGLSRQAVTDQLRNSVISSPFLAYKAEAIVNADYEATATVGLIRKDLDLIRTVAARQEVELPVTEVVDATYARAEELGFRDSDFASVIEVLAKKEATWPS